MNARLATEQYSPGAPDTGYMAPTAKSCGPPAPATAVPEGLAVIAEADLIEANRLVAQLRDAGIEAALGGKECCSSGGCGPKAAVLVPVEAIPRVRTIFEETWRSSVARGAGDPAVLARIAAAEAEGLPVCPACSHVGEPVAGECADCGLSLG